MNKKPRSLSKIIIAAVLSIVTIGVIVWAMFADERGRYVVLDPKGPIGDAQRDLIIISTILCAIIIVPTLILVGVIVWKYRDTPENKSKYTPNWSHNTVAETIWWGVPILIIIILGVVTVRYTYATEPSKPLVSDKEPITIQAVSLDWKWLFMYPDENVASVNTLTIPEDTPIRFELTSDAPMNSFWIPELGGQMYTMSGMAMVLHLQADEPGVYKGSGANFSGEHFEEMKFNVNAVSEEEYDNWVKEVKLKSEPLTEQSYDELALPSIENEQYFSAVPDEMFQNIVTKYVVEKNEKVAEEAAHE
ncbi:cytochrome aa3 quinol oxidase subunit II [Paenibacillus sp. Marseille-Q4541]|uniref:cytochrome aa3 quinol oxidase subunit II n=1 Tax=Paenibacillus sp. Marseille-Q4541 TaxID=2831522 RepID=UPI001BA96C6F|nr:cytochrome aa3 quinol oxidase subunit II [Paenibacillus sp. Marseille-Q4541]